MLTFEDSIREALNEEEELFFVIRRGMGSNKILFETNVDKKDIGHILFKPLVADGGLVPFEYAVEILKSIVETMEEFSNKSFSSNNKPN